MPRLVKRYSNRKLYDTSESRYVTLDEIARWVKAGEEVKIVENESGEDLTAVTFAQIILEEERKKNGYLSLPLLRNLIQHGEAALRLRGVVLFGADRGIIATALARHAPDVPVVEVSETDTGAMDLVVKAAAELAMPGDTVLLAPAAQSFDMFRDYPARGAAFAAAVRRLAALR